MNILITGAGGQLGRDCLQPMQAHHTIHAYSSSELDITRSRHVHDTLELLRPNVVINCAAFTAVDACEQEQDSCHAVNAQGPANLAAACTDIGCRLIHISTDYVFDGKKNIPEAYEEQERTAPLSVYGKSKLAGEQAIAQTMDDFLILRTAWLYGIGGKNFLKTMLRLAVADPQRTIRVVNDQYGALTWTRTLARQILEVLQADLTGIAHATASGHCSWFEGAGYFLKAMDVDFSLEPCTTRDYPTPAHRPANSILANSTLKSHGLDVMQSWQQDIDDFVALYRDDLLQEART